MSYQQAFPGQQQGGFPGQSPVMGGADAACVFCQSKGGYSTVKQFSQNGWIAFVVLLIFYCPLCWVPFLLDALYEDKRICLACNKPQPF